MGTVPEGLTFCLFRFMSKSLSCPRRPVSRVSMTIYRRMKAKELLATEASLKTAVPILRELADSEEVRSGRKFCTTWIDHNVDNLNPVYVDILCCAGYMRYRSKPDLCY